MAMTVGETHTPQATFKDSALALYAPTTVTAKVESPSRVITNPAVTGISLGVYQTTFTLTEVGVWRFEFKGVGPGGASGSTVILPGSVCALADVAA